MDKIGEYSILNKISEGGMAEVFLAKSTLSGSIEKYFAIKCLLPKYLNYKQFIELFTNEARIQVNMNHGNVASIFDFGIKSGRFYIAMEHINGVNARLFLKKQVSGLSLDEIVYVIRDAALGLDHAHTCKDLRTGESLEIIHGDISPENIMISTNGEVKVIDFGVAKKVDVIDKIQAGKKKYMSEDQASGKALNASADIYSLGRSLLEYLRRLNGFDVYLTADDHKKDFEEIKDKVPQEILQILEKSLGYSESSYKAICEMSKDLTIFLNVTYPGFNKVDLGEKVVAFSGKEFVDISRSIAAFTPVEEDDKTVVTTANVTGPGRQGIRRTRRRRVLKKKAS